MKLIYIAGPFRASTPWEIEQNIRRAEAVGLEVAKKMDGIPVIPHTMYRFFQDSLPDTFWLEAGLGLLRVCQALVLIPGWEKSQGSQAEKAEAERIGIPVYHWDHLHMRPLSD